MYVDLRQWSSPAHARAGLDELLTLQPGNAVATDIDGADVAIWLVDPVTLRLARGRLSIDIPFFPAVARERGVRKIAPALTQIVLTRAPNL